MSAKASTDATYLVHWGFVLKGGSLGTYMLTEAGEAFLDGAKTCRYALLKDNELVGTMTIRRVSGVVV